jgi:HemY protein
MSFKRFGFLLRIILIFAFLLWITNNPGSLILNWLGYEIETTVSFVLFLFFLLFLIGAAISSGWQGLLWVFKQILSVGSHLKKDPNQILAQAFSAIEFGNLKEAQSLAKEAINLNPESALPAIALLKASQLLHDKKTEELAISYLKKFEEFTAMAWYDEIEAALKSKRLDLAKKLISTSVKTHGDQGWFLKQALKVSIATSEWQEALEFLKKSHKKGSFTKEESDQIYGFLWYKLSLEAPLPEGEKLSRMEKSYEYDPTFLENLLNLAILLSTKKDKRAAQTLLEKAWVDRPSWPIAEVYCDLLSKDPQPLTKARQARKLHDLLPDHPVSQLILITYFIQAKLWGEAKRVLALLPKDVPEAYVLRAALVKKEKNNMQDALKYLKKAMQQISYPYKCIKCRKSMEKWEVSCNHCGSFLSATLKHPITYAHCLDALE